MYHFVMKFFPQMGQCQRLRQCIVRCVESCSIKHKNHGNTILFWFPVEDINSSDKF